MKQANMQSSAAEHTRSLGIQIEGKLTVQRWQDALRHADGRARFTAEYRWELYCRSCGETTVSTTPRKKQGQAPWPRKSDGTPELALAIFLRVILCGSRFYTILF